VSDEQRGDREEDEGRRATATALEHPPRVQAERSSSVRPGDVLAKKYRVERVIGEGGMGIVVAAHHLQLDEKVALKLLSPRALDSPEVVGRFAREARAAAKIKSEHVARAIDVGELDSGAPYIVMEYLEGSDLAAVLKSRGRLPAGEAIRFILEACEALAEAHVIGIVHRDLKPANLFLANQPGGPPIIKVLDFGISKSTSLTQDQLTKTSAIMGSPLYMSPEQMRSARTADVRSDIWSLGVVLYELLSGRVPFSGETMIELMLAIAQTPEQPLRAVSPDIDPGLEKVVHRCLAKDPGARFQNVGELAVALAPFAPARSDVSIERISQVLRASMKSPAATSLAPPAAGAVVLAGRATTDVSAPTVQGDAIRSQTGGNLAGSGATTTKAVSSDPSRGPPAGEARAARPWALPALGLAVVVIAGGLAWRNLYAPPVTGAPANSFQPGSGPSQPLPPQADPPANPGDVVPSERDVAPHPSQVPPPPPASSQAPPITPPHASQSPRPQPATRPSTVAPRPDCNPPYTIDSEGLRHYKRECAN
jgi:eukaryotic-like serine/threonine-protein kinase